MASWDGRPEEPRLSTGPAEQIGVLGITRILLRWSLVVVPTALLSLYAAVTLTEDIDPEYTATVSVLLVGPNEDRFKDFNTGKVNIEVINPLNNLGGSLSTVASVTSIAMSSGVVEEQLERENLSINYAVWVEGRFPVINVEVFDGDREVAGATADRLVELITADLQERQEGLGAPDTDRIFAQPVNASTVGGADFGGRNRVRIAIAAVGVALSVTSAFVLEGFYQLYRRFRIRRRFNKLPPPPTLLDAITSIPSIAAVSGGGTSEGATGQSESARLAATLHLILGDRVRAESIATESMEAVDQDNSTPAGEPARVWLYRTALARAVRGADPLAANGPERGNPPDDVPIRLWEVAGRLPADLRVVAALSRIGGFTSSQISQIVGVSEESVSEMQGRVSSGLDAGGVDSKPDRNGSALQNHDPAGGRDGAGEDLDPAFGTDTPVFSLHDLSSE